MISLNILTDVKQRIDGTTEFADLIFSCSMPELDSYTYTVTVQITTDFEEVDFEATPYPIFARVERSYESPIEYYYNTAAADILNHFETTYPGVDFELGQRVNAPQRLQDLIQEAYAKGDEGFDLASSVQSSLNDQITAVNVAISDLASDTTTNLAGKSNTGHGHSVSDITGLQAILDDFETRLSALE